MENWSDERLLLHFLFAPASSRSEIWDGRHARCGLGVGESEFEFGSIRVRPRERTIQSTTATVTLEPLVMRLLVALSSRAGHLVTRAEIFHACWGVAPVGDDSLNRVVALLRKSLQQAAGETIRIETVPGTGYVLRLTGATKQPDSSAAEVEEAIQAAFDSWRLGLPQPDHLSLEQMRRACELDPTNAKAWGMLALLCRHAAEYSDPGPASDHVRDCERAARRATALNPNQPEALTALISIVPLFGRWSDARRRLSAVLEINRANPVVTQDLATLEMATGRVRASMALRDSLIARDPLGACYCYKAVYQHWSAGDLAGMDHLADRAIQLWPTHPAVWTVRLWTLAWTERVPAALAMLDDGAVRPQVPAPTLRFLRLLFSAIAEGMATEIERARQASIAIARTGPANAIFALLALGLLRRPDDVFDLVDAYYLRGGSDPIPPQHTEAELSLNEHHRRLTQILFTPVFAPMRAEPRFSELCERIGLTRHWDETGLKPDFLA